MGKSAFQISCLEEVGLFVCNAGIVVVWGVGVGVINLGGIFEENGD